MKYLVYIEERILYADSIIFFLKRTNLFDKIFFVNKPNLCLKILKDKIDKNQEIFIFLGKITCNLILFVKKLKYSFPKAKLLLVCEPTNNGFEYEKIKNYISLFDGFISVGWKLQNFIKAMNYFVKERVVAPKRLIFDCFCFFKEKINRLEFNLTNREYEILKLICEGKINKEIATMLKLNVKTVKNHISKIYTKLGVKRRTEAINKAYNYGIV